LRGRILTAGESKRTESVMEFCPSRSGQWAREKAKKIMESASQNRFQKIVKAIALAIALTIYYLIITEELVQHVSKIFWAFLSQLVSVIQYDS
jgi:hypothetical protein